MHPISIAKVERRWMRQEQEIVAISCQEVRRELVNYMDDDISPSLRTRIERHFLGCRGCQATYDSLRNVIRLIADGEILELPEGFSRRLFERIQSL
jgi:putative zinc finger protein